MAGAMRGCGYSDKRDDIVIGGCSGITRRSSRSILLLSRDVIARLRAVHFSHRPGASPPSLNLVDRHEAGRVLRHAGGLVLHGKAIQSAGAPSQFEPASGSPPAITVARAGLERKGDPKDEPCSAARSRPNSGAP